ncbi:MAG: DUF1801 domain-containing protein [Pseudomonadota bacterium]
MAETAPAKETGPTEAEVADVIAAAEPAHRREEGRVLDALFREASGFEPLVWSGGMIGYGRYDYAYKSGRTGTWFATGFALRKANVALHIMPGYADFGDLLARLGPHKTGAACIYVTRLTRVDPFVIAEIVRAGLAILRKHYDVTPT